MLCATIQIYAQYPKYDALAQLLVGSGIKMRDFFKSKLLSRILNHVSHVPHNLA